MTTIELRFVLKLSLSDGDKACRKERSVVALYRAEAQ